MHSRYNRLFIYAALSIVSYISLVAFEHFSENDIIHEIVIHHPGMKEDKSCNLIEQKDEWGKTIAFNMDVKSVICLDGQCKIVDVKIIWDRLGAYTNYQLAEGVELEKKDGAPFTNADYSKLDLILKDKASLFSQFALGEVVDVKKDDGGIDGISGATILTEDHATVKGATWTCYTLWHWANSEVQSIIHDITSRSANKEELFQFFNKDDDRYKLLALNEFLRREIFDNNILDVVKTATPTLSREVLKTAIQYLKSAPTDSFISIFKELFPKGSEQYRLLFLDAFLDTDRAITQNFLQHLPSIICQLQSYQEVNMMVEYLEEKQISNADIKQQLVSLLDNDNFLSARRIYWYLSDQELKPSHRRRVKSFGKKHKESL